MLHFAQVCRKRAKPEDLFHYILQYLCCPASQLWFQSYPSWVWGEAPAESEFRAFYTKRKVAFHLVAFF